MPHLLVRGIPADRLKTVAKPLVAELASICSCGTDNFMLECLLTTSIVDGEIAASYPFIEVGWFERGQETRDRFARAVADHVQALGVPEFEIAFRVYEERSYYVNGEPIVSISQSSPLN
ncbi:DUF1904 family protein [Paenibacillus koleovorans]|uniref:DUF1904 family protein n=1 Tax=Paenibacillus koleovorans TaxID=121608 RepID=UPI000FD80901|nr:DUF1904 family protein [Paenibacillus koleovorans]